MSVILPICRYGLSSHREEAFITCTLTETSLIRLSMNPLVVGEAVSFAAAFLLGLAAAGNGRLITLSVSPKLHLFFQQFLFRYGHGLSSVVTRLFTARTEEQVSVKSIYGRSSALRAQADYSETDVILGTVDITFDKIIADLLHRSPELEPHLVIVES